MLHFMFHFLVPIVFRPNSCYEEDTKENVDIGVNDSSLAYFRKLVLSWVRHWTSGAEVSTL
jgi:hypothetical protein